MSSAKNMDWANFAGIALLLAGSLLVGVPRLVETIVASQVGTSLKHQASPTHSLLNLKTIFAIRARLDSKEEHLFGTIESAVAHGIVQAKELAETSFVLEERRTQTFQLAWLPDASTTTEPGAS